MTSYTNANGVTFDYTSTPSLIGGPGSLTISGDGLPSTTYSIPYSVLVSYVQTVSQTLELVNALDTPTFFDVPTATVTYDLLVALGGSSNFEIGGTGTVNVGVSGLSGITIDADGGAASFTDTAGAVSTFTGNIAANGSLTIGTGLLGLLAGSTIDYGANGGTLAFTGSTAVVSISSFTINDFTTNGVDFIDDQAISYAAVSSYSIVDSDGSQIITFFNGAGTSLGSVTTAGTALQAGTFTASATNGGLTLSNVGATLDFTPNICFLRGSRIGTPDGEVAVEALQAGDLVLTRSDGRLEAKPVTWVGRRWLDVALTGGGLEFYPVRIRAGAFAEGVPNRDLLVTSEHCIHEAGRLIPARMLVNGRSIIVDTAIDRYEYFHVELEQHAIIVAEGLETESYLDTGNRGTFSSDCGSLAARRPSVDIDPAHRSWKLHAAAPLAVDRSTVEPVWQRLADRAADLGLSWHPEPAALSFESDLRLVTDSGVTIRSILNDGGRFYGFALPPGTRSVRLVSKASTPAETVGPFVDDRRRLGVLVGRIGLNRGTSRIALDTHLTEANLEGWHGQEANPAFRWTNGDALLSLVGSQGAASFLDIEVGSAGPYLASEEAPERAVLAA